MANTLNLFPSGAVGFIDWLDGLFGTAESYIPAIFLGDLCHRHAFNPIRRKRTVDNPDAILELSMKRLALGDLFWAENSLPKGSSDPDSRGSIGHVVLSFTGGCHADAADCRNDERYNDTFHLTRIVPKNYAFKGAFFGSNTLEFVEETFTMGAHAPSLSVRQGPSKPKLLDQVRDIIRLRHYSIRTEQVYIDWIKRFILFHGKRHPREMAEAEVTEFLTHLARDGNVAASTQNQHVKAALTCQERI